MRKQQQYRYKGYDIFPKYMQGNAEQADHPIDIFQYFEIYKNGQQIGSAPPFKQEEDVKRWIDDQPPANDNK